MTSKFSRNIQVQGIAHCSMLVWPFQHLKPIKSFRHGVKTRLDESRLQKPSRAAEASQEFLTQCSQFHHQPTSLAALHHVQRFPPARGRTPQRNATSISHTSKPSPTTQGVLISPGTSSHLLTMLLSLLAWGILESSPFTLILVGDCTLRCSGSMDCWQVDMGM